MHIRISLIAIQQFSCMSQREDCSCGSDLVYDSLSERCKGMYYHKARKKKAKLSKGIDKYELHGN